MHVFHSECSDSVKGVSWQFLQKGWEMCCGVSGQI